MTPWMVLTVLVAAINLMAFTALRGRWDRRLLVLYLAALLGTATGNAIGASATAVHTNGWPGSTVQPRRSTATVAGAIRLRRRLSRIFQRAISGRRLR